MLVFSGRAPMCRGTLSAHGRISTALSAGAFPHDSADPSPASPGRMCSTAPTDPIPHIRTRQHRPNTANTSPVRPAAAREDGFCTPRGPALAFWEDRSGPPPEGAAHEPRNYAETGGSVRRVGANDPPRAPFLVPDARRGLRRPPPRRWESAHAPVGLPRTPRCSPPRRSQYGCIPTRRCMYHHPPPRGTSIR